MRYVNAKKLKHMKSNYTRLSLRNIHNIDDRFTNTKPIGILLSTYFLLFFYDLIQFATKTDTTMLLFTHTNSIEISNQNGQIERRLLLIYVFHHWSRPLAACVRNLLCLTTTSQTKCQKSILNRQNKGIYVQYSYRKVTSSVPVYYVFNFGLFCPKITIHKHQISP